MDSDAEVETLMSRHLLADDPRFGGRGRPAFVVTTPKFLRTLGPGSPPLRPAPDAEDGSRQLGIERRQGTSFTLRPRLARHECTLLPGCASVSGGSAAVLEESGVRCSARPRPVVGLARLD